MLRPTICREPTSPSTKLYKWVPIEGDQHPNQIMDAEIKQAVDAQLAAKAWPRRTVTMPILHWLPDRSEPRKAVERLRHGRRHTLGRHGYGNQFHHQHRDSCP